MDPDPDARPSCEDVMEILEPLTAMALQEEEEEGSK